jgi:uncharacterized membrane protein YcaP (DUF421 family)
MWFDGWGDLARVAIIGTLAYVSLVVVLRVSGKRTLAKMNAFDLVVTVAFGSTVATILLSGDVSYSEGLVALVLLAGLQYIVAALNVRARVARRISKSEPVALLRDGRFLEEALIAERVTRGEVRQALRSQGFGAIEGIAMVVLETDGSFSVIDSASLGSASALEDVRLSSTAG